MTILDDAVALTGPHVDDDLPGPRSAELSPGSGDGNLPSGLRQRMKVHFCGPTGANAVDAVVKLCRTATGRGEVVSFQGGFHGSSHAAMALTGLVEQKQPIPNGVPAVHPAGLRAAGASPDP